MKIAVITVCRNAEKTIARTIESFLAQGHADKEMLIFDGASSDGTLGAIEGLRDGQISVVSEPDGGMYYALNKGLARFAGDGVGALNADDTFHDCGVLQRIAEGLERSDIVHGDLNFVADHVGKQVVRRWRATDMPRRGFKTGWMPAHPTFYVRRAVAQTVGRFTTDYPMAADYDWMLRAMELYGFENEKLPGVLVDMMQGGVSTAGWASHVRHNIDALKARRKWLGAGLVDYAMFAKPAQKIGQFLVRGHGKTAGRT